jgi:hypothetical protein
MGHIVVISMIIRAHRRVCKYVEVWQELLLPILVLLLL